MSLPFVSVLMSVYNGECWLKESIKSVLVQTFKDFEFIIVNDGSTDGSLHIIEQFADQDSRIRIFDKPNTGLADSLNYGIERARSNWIARIDADDLCAPRRLEKQIKLIRSDKDLVLVGTGLKLIDKNGLVGKVYNYPVDHKNLVSRLTRGGSFFAHSSAMYRRKVVCKLGVYRQRILRAEDLDLWLRLSEYGKIGCVREPLVSIRKHDDQISLDEGGRAQLIDSYVAMVCYWLRQMQYQDPVESFSDQQFSCFRDWVEMKMESAGVFHLSKYLAGIKRNVYSSNSKREIYALLLSSFIGSPQQSYRWLNSKIFGSSLPKALARKWMGQSY